MNLTAVFLAIVTLAAIYGIHRAVAAYREATGSTWQRLLATAGESATVLWSYIVAAGGVGLAWADEVAQFLNAPEVTSFIQQHLSPTNVGVAMTAIAVITIVARLRTLHIG